MALQQRRPNHRVHLVDEQDHLTGRGCDFLQHCLEAFLKFAAVFGPAIKAPISSWIRRCVSGFRARRRHHALGQAFKQ